MSPAEIKNEFDNTLESRMQNPSRLANGFAGLFQKEMFESIARKRQMNPTDKSNVAYRYNEEGNIDNLLTEEEKEQILHLSGNIRCMAYGYWRTMNPD